MSSFFRHNRRGTPMAGFQTLLGLGLTHNPITYRDIIDQAADRQMELTNTHLASIP